ncbi:MAG: hypothetical protein OXF06_05635 [Bacteroidetes bacterium]|nr:hypothetical protein [Bacteroidota bacterium]
MLRFLHDGFQVAGWSHGAFADALLKVGDAVFPVLFVHAGIGLGPGSLFVRDAQFLVGRCWGFCVRISFLLGVFVEDLIHAVLADSVLFGYGLFAGFLVFYLCPDLCVPLGGVRPALAPSMSLVEEFAESSFAPQSHHNGFGLEVGIFAPPCVFP